MKGRPFKSDDTVCSRCRKFQIANIKYKLCRICNNERLHPDENFFEKQKRKSKESLDKKIEKMRFSLVRDKILNDNVCSTNGCGNTVTNKTYKLCYFHNQSRLKQIKRARNSGRVEEKQIKNQLSLIKKEAKEGKTVCEGCLKNKILQYSHILSVGQRKDLELDKDNKNLLCQSCHMDWESWNPNLMFKLNCIEYNLEFIRKKDTETFWKIYFKCIDYDMIKEAKKMEEIDNNFNKEKNG